MGDEAHKFDRRQTDVNVAAVSTELRALSETVHERIAPALEDNTRICTQLREAIFGHNNEDGMQMKVEEMHDAFTTMRNGMKVVSALGNGVMWAIEVGGKIAKPLLWILALGAAIWGYLTTGHWSISP